MSENINNNAFAPIKDLQWLFFDLNSYFASAEQQDRPELRNKPIAIVPSATDYTCAIAASYEAKAYGIKTGTKILDAKKLCPDLICVLARHDMYVDYHHRIFEEVENHIHVTKICSVDEAACRLFDNERTPAQATAIAHRIKAGLKENIGDYVRCSIGIAPNMFLAKTATDMQKPDGLVILHPHSFKEKLFELSLRDLCGIGGNIERRINSAGIQTVEQFWNLSPRHARQIWGSVEGERFWYSLHGYDIPDKPTEKSVVGHSRVLDPQHRHSEKAYAMARELALKACTRLRRYELYARKLSLSVRTVERLYWADEYSFSPTHDNFTITKALENMWRRMTWDTKKANLLKVSITLYDLYKSQDVTLDLFETNGTEQKAKNIELSEAIDALNKRYGANAVSLGSCPKTSAGFVGTKIAFTRVPEKAEFRE
jgi:DNA polymerase-4